MNAGEFLNFNLIVSLLFLIITGTISKYDLLINKHGICPIPEFLLRILRCNFLVKQGCTLQIVYTCTYTIKNSCEIFLPWNVLFIFINWIDQSSKKWIPPIESSREYTEKDQWGSNHYRNRIPSARLEGKWSSGVNSLPPHNSFNFNRNSSFHLIRSHFIVTKRSTPLLIVHPPPQSWLILEETKWQTPRCAAFSCDVNMASRLYTYIVGVESYMYLKSWSSSILIVKTIASPEIYLSRPYHSSTNRKRTFRLASPPT